MIKIKSPYVDIVNSGGPHLQIVLITKNDNKNNTKKGKPYLYAPCNKCSTKIYTPVNKEMLKLYFQSRITTKELFLINMDRPYYINENGLIKEVQNFDDIEECIESIQNANNFFYSLPRDMKIEEPFSDHHEFWKIF